MGCPLTGEPPTEALCSECRYQVEPGRCLAYDDPRLDQLWKVIRWLMNELAATRCELQATVEWRATHDPRVGN